MISMAKNEMQCNAFATEEMQIKALQPCMHSFTPLVTGLQATPTGNVEYQPSENISYKLEFGTFHRDVLLASHHNVHSNFISSPFYFTPFLFVPFL